MLFVIGTKGGISQQISSEDASNPYAKKEGNIATEDVTPQMEFLQSYYAMDNSLQRVRKSTNMSMAAAASASGDDGMAAYYISQS